MKVGVGIVAQVLPPKLTVSPDVGSDVPVIVSTLVTLSYDWAVIEAVEDM